MSYLREVGQSRPYYNKDKGKMARSRSRTSHRLMKWLKVGLLRRKISPFGGAQRRPRMRACGGRHITTHSFVVQTYSGSCVNLYWSRPLNQIEAQLYATLWTFFPLFIAEVHYLILRLSSISLSFDGNFSTLRTKAVVSSYTIVKYPLCSHAFKTGSILSLSLYIIGGKASHV